MRNKLIVVFLALSFLITRNDVFGQANRVGSTDIICPASGTSIEILPARPGRYSYAINNTSGLDVRIGYASSGTAALTTTTSFLLKAGQPYSDSAPGVYTGRLVCMSNSASPATISILETYR